MKTRAKSKSKPKAPTAPKVPKAPKASIEPTALKVEVTKPIVHKMSFFDSLKQEKEIDMGVQEIVSLFEKLDIALDDPLGGYLFYLMDCNDSTKITKQQFQTLTKRLKVDNLKDLKSKIPVLRKEFAQKQTFTNVYNYLFDLYKQTSQTKVLPFQVACSLWEIYFKGVFGLYDKFMNYLEIKAEKKSINRDTWKMIDQFRINTKNDLTNYNEMDGWPVFVDNFVNFAKSQ